MSLFNVPCVTVETITKHPNADSLEIITFKEIGWTVIDKLGKRTIGEKVIYIPVDSKVLTTRPEFEFLSPQAKSDGYARIKTIKLRSIFSQGLIIDAHNSAIVGEDYKDMYEIIKYEPEEEQRLNSPRGGSRYPSWCPKTDAERYQNVKNIVEPYRTENWISTIKIDGTSSSFGVDFTDDEKIICSRNLNITKNEDYFYHDINNKYDIINKIKLIKSDNLLSDFNNITNIMIQGEIAGPGIQKNRLGLSELEFFAFDIYIVSTLYVGYLEYNLFLDICKKYQIPTVPVYQTVSELPSLEDALNTANMLKYSNGHPIEGLVYVLSNNLDLNIKGIRGLGRAKVKIISQEFDVKVNKKD